MEVIDDSVVYQLGLESELRFVVGEETNDVSMELLQGHAEVYGSEVVQNKVYSIPPSSSIALFTWKGCSVKLYGKPEFAFVSSDTLMIIPVNLHACLEELRIKAKMENTKGPVSLVVGPTDVGKTTFCHTMLNYAARLGRRPLFIDLDVGQSSVSIPGTISILSVERQSDIIKGFNQPTLAVYPFGHTSPGHNMTLYSLIIKKLGQVIQTRLKNANPNTRSSGIIIDTCGWVRGQGYNAITLAACAFEIDVLFVIEEETLYLQLKRDMPASVQVVYVPKQYGVYERSQSLRTQNRDNRVWEYFYGPKGNQNTFFIDMKFSDINIYKVTSIDSDAVVDPQTISSDDIAIISVPFGTNLINSVVGLSYADKVDENLMMTNIYGFVCISNVDMQREVLTLLSPRPGPLPSKILIMGEIKFRKRSESY